MFVNIDIVEILWDKLINILILVVQIVFIVKNDSLTLIWMNSRIKIMQQGVCRRQNPFNTFLRSIEIYGKWTYASWMTVTRDVARSRDLLAH